MSNLSSSYPIDICFNMFMDTPEGMDPDSHSPTLRRYHQILWSKPLPNGAQFELDLDHSRLLHHNSHLGEFFLSSDAIGHTYKNVKRMSHVVDQVPRDELDSFFNLCTTIGGYVVFPSKQIDRKMTINAARGTNHAIQDRFDLTLECVRRHYLGEDNPLSQALERYSGFFALFSDFKGYVDFFLLQDLVDETYSRIEFWHPFEEFAKRPLPSDLGEYVAFKQKVADFITKRNHRIGGLQRACPTLS